MKYSVVQAWAFTLFFLFLSTMLFSQNRNTIENSSVEKFVKKELKKKAKQFRKDGYQLDLTDKSFEEILCNHYQHFENNDNVIEVVGHYSGNLRKEKARDFAFKNAQSICAQMNESIIKSTIKDCFSSIYDQSEEGVYTNRFISKLKSIAISSNYFDIDESFAVSLEKNNFITYEIYFLWNQQLQQKKNKDLIKNVIYEMKNDFDKESLGKIMDWINNL